MAPKLTPDNLTLPGSYLLDLDRNALDDSIFPLPHCAGKLEFTPHSFSKKYTSAQALPSPYKDDRFITDIQTGSEFDGIYKEMKYVAMPPDGGVVEDVHYLGNAAPNRLEIEKVMKNTKMSILKIGNTRAESRCPGSEVEIITLGTGSAIPNKIRNGTQQ